MNRSVSGWARCAVVALAVWAGGVHSATEERTVAGFEQVVFALPGKLTLSRGDEFGVVIEADEEDLERIETVVRGDELVVRFEDGPFGIFGGRPHGAIQVRVTMPALRGLEVAGSGDVEGGSWLSETFRVEVNGSGSVHFEELATEELVVEIAGSGSLQAAKVDAAGARVEVSGSGDVKLAGAADRQEIEVMGSGDVDAAELEGAAVEVEIMGSGDVSVWANENLTVEIMGSGDVRYRGSPRVESEEHGSGRVRAL